MVSVWHEQYQSDTDRIKTRMKFSGEVAGVSQDEMDKLGRSDLTLRRRMLDAGQRLVSQAGGLRISLEHLSMDGVIKEAGVPRASAYREWSSREAFQLDLLCDLAGPSWQGTAAFDEETIRLVRQIVADNLELLSTVDGRRRLLHEVVRQGAHQNFETLTSSPQWLAYVTLTGAVMSIDDDGQKERVLGALRNSEGTFIGRMGDFYEDLSIVFGFRLRRGVPNFRVVAALGAAVVEGLALRRVIAPDVVDTPVMVDGPSHQEAWHLASVGFLAVLEQMIEPVDDYDFATALPKYLNALSDREVAATTRALRGSRHGSETSPAEPPERGMPGPPDQQG